MELCNPYSIWLIRERLAKSKDCSYTRTSSGLQHKELVGTIPGTTAGLSFSKMPGILESHDSAMIIMFTIIWLPGLINYMLSLSLRTIVLVVHEIFNLG